MIKFCSKKKQIAWSQELSFLLLQNFTAYLCVTKTGKDPMHLSYSLFQNARGDPSSEVALYLKENIL